VRFASDSASALAHTTMYLDEDENALLSGLPAVTLRKTRHVLPLSDRIDVAVDVFHGALSGLTLAEFDLGSSLPSPEHLPGWLGVEVTDREEFTGHALARLDSSSLARLLSTYDL
jgi:CYTH domain-containing protein